MSCIICLALFCRPGEDDNAQPYALSCGMLWCSEATSITAIPIQYRKHVILPMVKLLIDFTPPTSTEENECLKAEIDSLRAELASTRATVERYRTENDRLQFKLADCRNHFSKRAQAAEERFTRIYREAGCKVSLLEHEHVRLQNETIYLRHRYDTLQLQYTQLQNEYKVIEDASSGLSGEVEALNFRVKTLTSQLTLMQEDQNASSSTDTLKTASLVNAIAATSSALMYTDDSDEEDVSCGTTDGVNSHKSCREHPATCWEKENIPPPSMPRSPSHRLVRPMPRRSIAPRVTLESSPSHHRHNGRHS
ncbi:hypothetical protein JR316_0007775 [Psilocybe cubensis]|uniref:Uncharacterized protein n=2 Tax=Psilocybe cubensis TaxID=181762 RepID=A0ACB8GUQ3_PSICU|nr:hypothetical protein JR316_0007775 [Psilocybe cubensis]KAH9479189.1 hypothetical protein JR316_0007775 [Psilocybe cubensis]